MNELGVGDVVEFCSPGSGFTATGVIDSIFNSAGWWQIKVIESNAPHLRPGMFATVCENDIVMGLF